MIESVTDSRGEAEMSARARCAPREARRRAVARPIPEAAPVIVITFPEREEEEEDMVGDKVEGVGVYSYLEYLNTSTCNFPGLVREGVGNSLERENRK